MLLSQPGAVEEEGLDLQVGTRGEIDWWNFSEKRLLKKNGRKNILERMMEPECRCKNEKV